MVVLQDECLSRKVLWFSKDLISKFYFKYMGMIFLVILFTWPIYRDELKRKTKILVLRIFTSFFIAVRLSHGGYFGTGLALTTPILDEMTETSKQLGFIIHSACGKQPVLDLNFYQNNY